MAFVQSAGAPPQMCSRFGCERECNGRNWVRRRGFRAPDRVPAKPNLPRKGIRRDAGLWLAHTLKLPAKSRLNRSKGNLSPPHTPPHRPSIHHRPQSPGLVASWRSFSAARPQLINASILASERVASAFVGKIYPLLICKSIRRRAIAQSCLMHAPASLLPCHWPSPTGNPQKY